MLNNIIKIDKVESITKDNIIEIDLVELDIEDKIIIDSISNKRKKYIINNDNDIKLHINNSINGVGYIITKIDNSKVLYI